MSETDTTEYLSNQFLIAMPALEDENFNHSVTLLCEHSDQGALGLIINRPLQLKLTEMLDQMDLPRAALDQDSSIYWGGPVAPERGFVIHEGAGAWDSTMAVGGNLYITTSRDILKAIGEGRGPRHYFVALGYAGWSAGQLESEILSNSWLNTPVDSAILFRTPASERWKLATRLLGVDPTQLGGEAGHA
jgi:putative transcriptional regulator